MNPSEQHESEVALPARLTVSAVGPAHAEILAAISREGRLVVDGTKVEVADASGVQLVAAVLIARSDTVLRASPALAESLTLTGLAFLAG